MSKSIIRLVSCPICKKSVEYSPKNPDRPFCSERCRVQDSAAWADDQYAIPAEKANERDLEE